MPAAVWMVLLSQEVHTLRSGIFWWLKKLATATLYCMPLGDSSESPPILLVVEIMSVCARELSKWAGLESRAGRIGFAVLQCSSASYFQANLTIKIRPGLLKQPTPQSGSLENEKKAFFII